MTSTMTSTRWVDVIYVNGMPLLDFAGFAIIGFALAVEMLIGNAA